MNKKELKEAFTQDFVQLLRKYDAKFNAVSVDNYGDPVALVEIETKSFEFEIPSYIDPNHP